MPFRSRYRLLSLSFWLSASLAGPWVSTVSAAEPDVVKQVERLNKKALEDYDSLEFESARQTLQSAIGKLRDAGLDETPAAAQTYVNLGMVIIAGFKDRNRGIQLFINAVKIDPTVQIDPERATPELQEAFNDASKQYSSGAGGTGDGKKPPKPEPEEEIKGLQHAPVDEAKVNHKVAITARLQKGLAVQRIFLFYRGGGQEDFVSVPMDEGEKGTWNGEIPGEAITGRAVQYYIEARDAKGRPAVAAGSAASPFIISVTGSVLDADNPLRRFGKEDKDDKDKTSRGFGRLYLSALAGTGIGIEFVGNHTEVAYQYNASQGQYIRQPVGATGVAFAPMHVGVELGVNITQAISIGAIGRFQLVTGGNADSYAAAGGMMPALGSGTHRASGAIAGMLRFKYRFGTGRFHPYVHIDVGGGQIRHALDISGAEPTTGDGRALVDYATAQQYNATPSTTPPTQINEICADHNNCVDTIALGFILFGGGGGFWYDLAVFRNGGFGIVFDLNALAAVGDQFGLNLDIQLGFGVHFL